MRLFLLLLLVPFSAYGEPIPDYDSPYAPIYTDSPRYSWTDKMTITIVAPSWNSDRNLIDSIGGTEDHAIKVSTRGHSLEPYRFTETGANSGVFTAEVTLTGFPHDADGDGNIDTAPRTAGSGPTGGFLQADRDTAVTISFEFADGVILTESVPVGWNLGTVQFSKNVVFSGESATVRVTDPDMNLNPEAPDTVRLQIFSDTDAAGIHVDAIEASERSGSFVATFSISQTRSGGDTLHAAPGDVITARYGDHTLPKPHAASDSLNIEGFAKADSSVPPAQRLASSPVVFSDSLGNKLQSFSPHDQIQIVGNVANKHDFKQRFVYVFQVKDPAGFVESVSWIRGDLLPRQSLDMSRSWIPQEPGTYAVETFVWDSLGSQVPLAGPVSASATVG